MATRKKAATAQEPTITAPVVFPKERVLTFRRYADRRDLLSVLLEDGKEYTFHLRKDVTFTDGTPFNAEAVKANMDAIVSNLPRHAWLDMVNEIDRNEVVDEYTYSWCSSIPTTYAGRAGADQAFPFHFSEVFH